jgi:hypothetical protein
MTMVSSGVISMGDINTELGHTQVPALQCGLNDPVVRVLGNHTSGTISLYDFYGTTTSNDWAEEFYFLNGDYASHWGYLREAIIDSSGNIYISGSTHGNVFYVVKLDNYGRVLWNKQYGNDYDYSMQPVGMGIDSAGYIYVLDGSGDYTGIKINSSGTLIQSYANLSGTIPEQGACADSSGIVYVVGADNITTTDYFAYIVKYNINGTIAWQRSASASYKDYYEQVAVDSSGNVYILGRQNQSTLSTPSYATFSKYNSSGTLQWFKLYNLSYWNSGNSILIDSADNIYATGGSYLIKFNSSGTILWQKLANGQFSFVGKDSSQNIYVDNGTELIKLNSSGTVVWRRTISYNGSARGTGGTCITDSYILDIKSASLNGYGTADAGMLVKIPNDGTSFNGNTYTDKNGNTIYFGAGSSFSVSTSTSITTVTGLTVTHATSTLTLASPAAITTLTPTMTGIRFASFY